MTDQDRYQLMTFNGLEIAGLSAELGGKRVLQSINFSLQKGNVLAILGPSGCGKSTLLKSNSWNRDPNRWAHLLELGGYLEDACPQAGDRANVSK